MLIQRSSPVVMIRIKEEIRCIDLEEARKRTSKQDNRFYKIIFCTLYQHNGTF